MTESVATVADRVQKIKAFFMDVDGTMTDGTMVFGFGDEGALRAFNARDGHGISMLHKAKINVGIITSRKSRAVTDRARELRIPDLNVFQGEGDKLKVLKRWLFALEMKLDQVAFIGDDLGDHAVMQEVGLAIAVGDACQEIKNIAHHVTSRVGGKGAVREAIEFILRGQGRWNDGVSWEKTDARSA